MRFLTALVCLTIGAIALGNEASNGVCLNELREWAAKSSEHFYLVTPLSGAEGLTELARAVLPRQIPVSVWTPFDPDFPTGPADVSFYPLPKHTADLRGERSLLEGVGRLTRMVGNNTPSRVIIGSEAGVDWGLALRNEISPPSKPSVLTPSEMVSKRSVRTILEKAGIPHLVWPLIFEEHQFENELKTYAAQFPERRVVVKFDSSSGMNGLQIGKAKDVFELIALLKGTVQNKHLRSSAIIVEEFIDDMPLPEGQRWKEVAFDAIAYLLPDAHEILLKYISAWVYEKSERKMYVSDTLANPLRNEFARVRQVLAAIANVLHYSEGALHFEVYVAVDSQGNFVQDTPVVLGDPNFRLGGNNKFGKMLWKRGAFSVPPNELLLLGAINPQVLHGIEPKVKEGHAMVPALSFPNAPSQARFNSDPARLVSLIRQLPTFGADTIEWTSENYRNQKVGKAEELKDAIEILLVGEPADIERDHQEIRRIEEALSKIMISTAP